MNNDLDRESESGAKEEMLKVLWLYRTALELSHYKSLWYRLLAWTGYAGARSDQVAVREAERLATLFVNSSPDRQQIWKNLCEQESAGSRTQLFLLRVLRPTCAPLPKISPEEKKRRQAEAFFFCNRIQQVLSDLAQLQAEIESKND